MIGLAYKAGKVKFGSEVVTQAIRGADKPCLVLLAGDASANQIKRITNSCDFHNVKLLTLDEGKEELGHITGGRSELACVAICDTGFANAIENLIGNNKSEQTAVSAGGAQ